MITAYQCSRCKHLRCIGDDRVTCIHCIDPRPGHREKDDAELCRTYFQALEEKDEWHAKFSWETGITRR